MQNFSFGVFMCASGGVLPLFCCDFKIKEDMRRTKVKVGIVGLGLNGRKHAIAHANSLKSELVAICDRDEGKLRAFGAELGVRKLFTIVDELLADPEIEAVNIHTSDGQHLEPFLKVLEASKHILIEKPLANTEADVMAMVKAAGHGGGDFFEILDFVDAIEGRRQNHIGIHEAMDMTLPGGLVSQQSIAKGSAWLPVPDSRKW